MARIPNPLPKRALDYVEICGRYHVSLLASPALINYHLSAVVVAPVGNETPRLATDAVG